MEPKYIVVGQRVEESKVILAKKMRSAMTPAEEILWEQIRANRLDGLRFRRQQIIAGFIADFYCHSAALAIELDGDTHEPQADSERDAVFTGKGIRTLRFQNAEVYANIESVLQRIQAAITDKTDVRKVV